ncbi:MAG: response regulator transcription factor [Merdibacter sp.]
MKASASARRSTARRRSHQYRIPRLHHDRAPAYDQQELPRQTRSPRSPHPGLYRRIVSLQIAQQLQIKIPTVKSHISNIFTKLGVRNRASAISEARKNGYLKG